MHYTVLMKKTKKINNNDKETPSIVSNPAEETFCKAEFCLFEV